MGMGPDHIRWVVAQAMLTGLIGKAQSRAVLIALPGARFAAGFVGLRMEQETSPIPWNTPAFMAGGVLLAYNIQLPDPVMLVIAAGLGGLHGFLSGTAMAEAGGGHLSVVGITFGLFVLVVPVCTLVVSLKYEWTRIAVRVAGSWIAAIGLLMLGWAFRDVAN